VKLRLLPYGFHCQFCIRNPLANDLAKAPISFDSSPSKSSRHLVDLRADAMYMGKLTIAIGNSDEAGRQHDGHLAVIGDHPSLPYPPLLGFPLKNPVWKLNNQVLLFIILRLGPKGIAGEQAQQSP